MFTGIFEMDRSKSHTCALVGIGIVCLPYNTSLYNTSPQHSFTTLLYNTSPQHFSTTLHDKTSLQHFNATLLHNSSL